ncbi:MAG: hypothetical protein GC178_05310 [Flavobacteriales bacterium]|nr:hypothetical protein [Flavobacteriales bacterium]
MKETEFIEQNKEKWQNLEAELQRGTEARPDSITHLYIDSVDDLSFARTTYPNRMVRAYLNGVVEVLSLMVQRSQRNYRKNIVAFWKTDLPLAIYEGRRQFLLSFIILCVSIGIGIFSSMHDKTFATYILGPEYIETTLENIEKGDPLAIYKRPEMGQMFFQITLNNILVSARTFVLSLFIGFGTIIIIVYNGVMLGVFQYFFIERGLFFESFLTIWQHGVIEISCIVLAGAAGLVLAKGILFPGSYSRLDSFRINGRKSLMIMLGLMPLLVLSGAIEAYVTRFTDAHWSIRLLSILISLTFILTYFVVYPRMVAKTREEETPSVAAQPMVTSEFSLTGIRTNAAIFWESIRVLFAQKRLLMLVMSGLGILLTVVWWVLGVNAEGKMNSTAYAMNASIWYLHTDGNVIRMACSFLVILSSLLVAHWAVWNRVRSEGAASTFTFNWRNVILISILLAVIETAVLINLGVTFLFAFLYPVIGLLLVLVFHTGKGESPWTITRQMLGRNYGKLLALVAFYGFAIMLVALLTREFVGDLLVEFISYFVVPDSDVLALYLMPAMIAAATLFLFSALVHIAMHLSYYSLKEIRSATSLSQRIDALFPVRDDDARHSVTILRKDVFS